MGGCIIRVMIDLRRAFRVALGMLFGLAIQVRAAEPDREKRPDRYGSPNITALQAQLNRLSKGRITQKDLNALSEQIHYVNLGVPQSQADVIPASNSNRPDN